MPFFAALPAPSFLVMITGGTHGRFSDMDSSLSPERAAASTRSCVATRPRSSSATWRAIAASHASSPRTMRRRRARRRAPVARAPEQAQTAGARLVESLEERVARNDARAPRCSRCGVRTWMSIQERPRARRWSIRWRSASFEALALASGTCSPRQMPRRRRRRRHRRRAHHRAMPRRCGDAEAMEAGVGNLNVGRDPRLA